MLSDFFQEIGNRKPIYTIVLQPQRGGLVLVPLSLDSSGQAITHRDETVVTPSSVKDGQSVITKFA